MSTVASEFASLPIVLKTSCIELAWPSISDALAAAADVNATLVFSLIALLISSTAESMSKGFGRYS